MFGSFKQFKVFKMRIEGKDVGHLKMVEIKQYFKVVKYFVI